MGADTGIITVAADKYCGLADTYQRRDGYRTMFDLSGLNVHRSLMMSYNRIVTTSRPSSLSEPEP
jgi:hypothetical protein